MAWGGWPQPHGQRARSHIRLLGGHRQLGCPLAANASDKNRLDKLACRSFVASRKRTCKKLGMTRFALPPEIAELISARNNVRDHYNGKLQAWGSGIDLSFTLDGNLVGDLGEALAMDLFDIRLVEVKSTAAIDGFTPDGRSVQVKATGTGRGPAFRNTETRADHLLFFDLDFENATGAIIFNGPEHYAVASLPAQFTGQRSLTRNQIRAADKLVRDEERLPLRNR